ncbi:hypothetical protein [Methylocapsa acidiphila]|uniref:hypothetical protein n=1 Tax=Methylocapsa acidiphila TaxID=133552 RepID=UPI0003FF4C05|nr:hypothetical protein [Methylocapsa acidiphila]
MTHAPARPPTERKDYPHNFRRIRLELAREKGHPGGNARDGYILVIPLDKEARIDVETWRAHRDLCRVVRFREGEVDEIGRLQHKHGRWSFHYANPPQAEDENALHLESDQFAIGTYVAIREDGAAHTFQVASVDYI